LLCAVCSCRGSGLAFCWLFYIPGIPSAGSTLVRSGACYYLCCLPICGLPERSCGETPVATLHLPSQTSAARATHLPVVTTTALHLPSPTTDVHRAAPLTHTHAHHTTPARAAGGRRDLSVFVGCARTAGSPYMLSYFSSLLPSIICRLVLFSPLLTPLHVLRHSGI
jgi:hypothetical protein